MRCHSWLLLAIAGCTPGASLDAPDPEELPACGRAPSPLFEHIFEAARGQLERGTLPSSHFATGRNAVEPTIAFDARNIYARFAQVIATARTAVDLQTFSWTIIGSANLDTQSWTRSREVNVVLDDPTVVAAWDAEPFGVEFTKAVVVDEWRGRRAYSVQTGDGGPTGGHEPPTT
jgi:hypothetical protein